jgi:multicomponent Na+:H+ antiporter subunit D
VVFTLAALGRADLPPLATYLGKGWIEDSSAAAGSAWVAGVLIACSILVGGAVLRVAGGVFWGLGDPPAEDPRMAAEASEEKSETDEGQQHTPLTMLVPAAVLVAGAVVVGLWPDLGAMVQDAAVRFQDQAAYNQAVMFGRIVAHPVALHPAGATAITPADVLSGAGSALGALIVAGLSLYRRRIPLLRRGPEPDLLLADPVRRLQSGVINDYVTWIVVGVAGIGAYLAVAIR